MSLLLAPYNSAMRLGMGFNSFTQQLCINDAVKLEGGKGTASERSLRPQYKLGTMTAPDGVADVSQVVTWTAKFVDRISEVTDSMNVSGSLEIKADALGGGGGAQARFMDSNKFKESDINYFIQVKVTNEKLVAPNLTQFSPIPNVPPSEFTRVYGDSFISGFTEGGEFNALISIKLKDRSQAKEFGGKLKMKMDRPAISVEGEVEGEKKSLENSYEGETTIAVSWTGGGDIKDGTVAEWSLDTLKSVAIEFPEHVMACPMRTNAILTKYTSLKSFYETQLLGSPLDYENAGVYSAALLDAYMDYKIMWRNIQTALWEVEQGQSELHAKTDIPEFAEFSREAKAHYNDQADRRRQKMITYDNADVYDETTQGPTTEPESDATTVPQTQKSSAELTTSTSTAEDVAITTNTNTTGVPAIEATAPATTTDATQAPASSAIVAQSVPTTVAAPATLPSLPTTSTTVNSPAPGSKLAKRPARTTSERPPERPLPPNELVPYKATIFGLDKARRDCRFEMIKIVDAVAEDPKIAIDPERSWQYLSPAIFRMLLPTVINLDAQKAALQAAEEAKLAIQSETKAHQEVRDDLTSTKRALDAAEEKLKQAEEKAKAGEDLKRELDPYGGYCPVPLDTPIRFKSVQTGACLDYAPDLDLIHQWEAHSGTNQCFVITRANRTGYFIHQLTSNKYLTMGPMGATNRIYTAMRDVGNAFVFEPSDNGSVMIRPADRTQYTMNVEGGNRGNATKVIFWPHPKNNCDRWMVKSFADWNS